MNGWGSLFNGRVDHPHRFHVASVFVCVCVFPVWRGCGGGGVILTPQTNPYPPRFYYKRPYIVRSAHSDHQIEPTRACVRLSGREPQLFPCTPPPPLPPPQFSAKYSHVKKRKKNSSQVDGVPLTLCVLGLRSGARAHTRGFVCHSLPTMSWLMRR